MARKQSKSFKEHFTKIFHFFVNFGTIQPTIIAVICWVIVVVGSWLYDFHRPPEFYFSDKENVLNVLFAKWSLAWTLGLLTPYMVLSYLKLSKNNLKVVFKNVFRLVVALIIWFSVTTVFEWVDNFTGACEGSDFYSKKFECIREGLIWRGFDISGHSFLLTYCTLIISEEIQIVSLLSKEKDRSKCENEVHNYASNLLYICCCLLMMLWLVLLAITSIYFHTVETKVLGFGISLTAWLVTYKVYFQEKAPAVGAKGF